MLRVLEARDEQRSFLRSLRGRAPGENAEILESVKRITSKVESSGRHGILALREQFEGVSFQEPLVYKASDLVGVAQDCPKKIREIVKLSIERVRRYHEIQREESRSLDLGEDRGKLTSLVRPLDSVAVYVPGGKAFYPSTVVMTVVPAQVAQVPRIVLFTPGRSVSHPVFAATVLELGVEQVVAVGGAQAVAASAYGFEGFERCDKIVGPGNVYVATAKQVLSGHIGIDSYAGPSEILVLGDGSSPASWAAADLLAQAEHDEEASAVLICTDKGWAYRVREEVKKTLPKLKSNSEIAVKSLEKWGAILVVSDKQEMCDMANELASEHLHIHTECAGTKSGESFWLENIRAAGAIFMGKYTAEAFGDYLAGPSHVLPTGGTARFASPLGVYDFQRRSSVIQFSQKEAQELAHLTAEFAEAEGLLAHAESARLRNDK